MNPGTRRARARTAAASTRAQRGGLPGERRAHGGLHVPDALVCRGAAALLVVGAPSARGSSELRLGSVAGAPPLAARASARDVGDAWQPTAVNWRPRSPAFGLGDGLVRVDADGGHGGARSGRSLGLALALERLALGDGLFSAAWSTSTSWSIAGGGCSAAPRPSRRARGDGPPRSMPSETARRGASSSFLPGGREFFWRRPSTCGELGGGVAAAATIKRWRSAAGATTGSVAEGAGCSLLAVEAWVDVAGHKEEAPAHARGGGTSAASSSSTGRRSVKSSTPRSVGKRHRSSCVSTSRKTHRRRPRALRDEGPRAYRSACPSISGRVGWRFSRVKKGSSPTNIPGNAGRRAPR